MSDQDPAEQPDTTQAEVPIIVLPTDQPGRPELSIDFSAFEVHPEMSDLSDIASIGYQVDRDAVSDHYFSLGMTFEGYAYSEVPVSPSPVSPAPAPVSPYIGSPNVGVSDPGTEYIDSPYLAPYPSGDSDASHSTTGSVSGEYIDLTLDDQDDFLVALSDVEASSIAGPSDDTRPETAASRGREAQRDIEEWFSVADNAARFKAEFDRLKGWWWGDQFKKTREIRVNGFEGKSRQAIYAHFASLKPPLRPKSVMRMWTNTTSEFKRTNHKHWSGQTKPAHKQLATMDTADPEISHSAAGSAPGVGGES